MSTPQPKPNRALGALFAVLILVMIVAVVGLALLASCAAAVADDPKARHHHVRVFAHGGYHRSGIAKDSIRSQVEAYKRDLCPETDVRHTSDHVIVNMHDAKVDTSTNGHGFVGDMTYAEVHALSLSDGQHPPSLERSMKVAASHGRKCILVEVKDTDWTPEDYRYIQERAQHYGLGSTFRLYISRVPFIRMADANAPDLKVVWKLLHETDATEVSGLSLDAIVPRNGRLFRPFIDSIHGIGVKVYAGVNACDEPDEWARLTRLRIDGMLNNVPAATLRWLTQHGVA